MKKTLIVVVVIAVVLGGLLLASKIRTTKNETRTTEEIWAEEGIPVGTARVSRGDMERTVEVTGDINALKQATLSAKIAGRVVAVYAREGDRVSKGQTIVLLDQDDALSGVRQAEAGLSSAKARLSQAKTNAKVTKIQTSSAIEQAEASLHAAQAGLAIAKDPARSQERMVAENDVVSAKANLDNAEANYKRYKEMLSKGAISQSAFDVVEATYRVAKAQHKSAQDRLSLIEEGGRTEEVQAAQSQVEVAQEQLRAAKANESQNLVRREDIKSAEAAVKQAGAGLALAQQQLSYASIKSPISGELSVRATEPGHVVAPGQTLGEVVNLKSVYFKGDLSEKELIDVSEGQSVRVTIDAIPKTIFGGVIGQIYPAGSARSRYFPVRIRIDSPSELIRPGMFARGEIVTGYARNAFLVPKDAVEERRGTKMVFSVRSKTVVPTSGKDKGKSLTIQVAKRHNIDVIHENREYVQIQPPPGLNVGDKVVTRGRQNLEDGSRVSLPDK